MSEQKVHLLDIKRQTKQEACFYLWKAEMTYLMSRGWETLVGGSSPKCFVAPGDDYRSPDCVFYTHDEALVIQKEKDEYTD